jgi:hypothetical protein
MKTIPFIALAAFAAGTALAQQRPTAPPAPLNPQPPPPSFVPAVAPASAQQRFDRRRPARSDGAVEINNISGSIRVIGWDKSEVEVTGTLGKGLGLDFSGDSLRTVIRVFFSPGHADPPGESNIEVRIPASTSRTAVRTVSADIEVSKVTGGVVLKSVSGDLRALDDPREVEAGSMNGEIELSVSSPRIRARSASGTITLQNAKGDVEASTVNGKVIVKGGQFERGRFSTINGEIQFDGDLKPDGVFQFDTVNGDVDLLLPASVKADFNVSASSIGNEFGPPAQPWSGYGSFGQGAYPLPRPGVEPRDYRRLTFSTGGGGASVTVSVFNGTARLRKK